MFKSKNFDYNRRRFKTALVAFYVAMLKCHNEVVKVLIKIQRVTTLLCISECHPQAADAVIATLDSFAAI